MLTTIGSHYLEPRDGHVLPLHARKGPPDDGTILHHASVQNTTCKHGVEVGVTANEVQAKAPAAAIHPIGGED